MSYLVGHLAIWLLLAAASAALTGWALAAERGEPRAEQRARERESLLQDLIRYSGDGADAPEPDRIDDSSQRLLSLRDARIAELERSLEATRSRADELGGEVAELQRRGSLNNPDADELVRLRAQDEERARTVDAEVSSVEDENTVLQAWRLRYFEQRVSYLESQARAMSAPRPSTPPLADERETPLLEWSVREANARASFLEDELRRFRSSESEAPETVAELAEPEPFAADADVDALLRWRLLYLERRVAHLQGEARAQPTASEPVRAASYEPDRWKWRARYLEARVRHLEQRPAPAIAPHMQEVAEPVEAARAALPRPATPSRRAKPPVLASARNGAPDDLTLIEGVSLLQQTTLYALGVFHFDQIAAWSDDHIAWVDQYLRLAGRIEDEEWVEQASELAQAGPAASRRALHDQDV
jgi:predicted flap endonuclease-1-like 5' DNA nuclease